ncbi:MAG TPA: GNAT family N-acetyltransferase [Acidobacteriota bacterium]|nr:GNAT family N-acetyltransferase [Acidobacteriota bacterium]
MSLLVGPVRERELAEALRIDRASGLHPWSSSDLRKCAVDPKWLLLGARSEAAPRLAGFALALLLPPEAELHKIAVLKRFQRKGVATALLEAVLVRARAAGCHSCILEARSENRAALELYARFGFQKVLVRSDYYRNPDDHAWVMRVDMKSEGRTG